MPVKLKVDRSVMLTGDKTDVVIEVKGKTIGECLTEAVKKKPGLKTALYEENGFLRFNNLVSVNGEFVTSDVTAKEVKDGDEINIVNFSGGG